MEILKEWFFADDPPAGYGRKISDTMFLVEAGGTVTTQVSLKQIPIVIISASYNIGFIARSYGVDYLSKRSLINNPDSYFLMLDEKLL